jgi:ATP adenylyltransferase
MASSSNAYRVVRDFIQHKMRMSHIYQPVMLRELLKHRGKASVNAIAKALLIRDQSQIEYYEAITKGMVGRVLTKNRGITERVGDEYLLKGFDELSDEEKKDLTDLCEAKIEEYTQKRGKAIWEHRAKSAGYVSGTLRYEVLKRAKFRCELCGVMDKEKALEVDHIIPRNKGGSDDVSNLQSLCYSCNAMKRDRDDVDFRDISESYKHRDIGCAFCDLDAKDVIAENELCFAIRDKFPVTRLHTLIMPKRHVAEYFQLYQPELNATSALMARIRADIVSKDATVGGFNVGVNAGSPAGQTIFHCHIHIIPRRNGDTADPRGGVRGVIPEKQPY